MQNKFYSDKSSLCQIYGEGLIVEEYGGTLKVEFTDKEGGKHIGVFTKSKHKENET